MAIPPQTPEDKGKPTPSGENNGFYKGAPANPRDLITYVLLFLGLLLLFIVPLYGEFLIGIVAGVYFSKELVEFVNGYKEIIEEQGFVRSLVLAALLLTFIITTPALFVGAIIVALLRLFVFTEPTPKQ